MKLFLDSLFEVFEQGNYIYQGKVELVGEPYQKVQRDFEGNKRLTWMFPVKVIGGEPFPVSLEIVEDAHTVKERQLRKLTTAEIYEKVRGITPTRATRRTISDSYVRDPYVSMLAKRRADGCCQLCGKEAPFKDRYGEISRKKGKQILLTLIDGQSTILYIPKNHFQIRHVRLSTSPIKSTNWTH